MMGEGGGCTGGGGPSCFLQLGLQESSETWEPQRKTRVGIGYPFSTPLREGRGVGGTRFSCIRSVLLQHVLSLPFLTLLATFLIPCQCSESIYI